MYYFVISRDCDEIDCRVQQMNYNEVLNFLQETDVEFLDAIKNNNSTHWNDGKTLIIKGDIVVPKPKKVIETYDID